MAIAIHIFGVVVLTFVVADVGHGIRGYDSYYYRFYIPYTAPLGSDEALAQIRNLPLGVKAWVRRGGGCEYLVSHEHRPNQGTHTAAVHAARSRFGLPCHRAPSEAIIADDRSDPCRSWQARRKPSGGGWMTHWTCTEKEARRGRSL